MKLLGWSFEQIARAKAMHRASTSEDATIDINGLCDVRKWWRLNKIGDPLDVVISGSEPEMDYEWASGVIKSK